MRKTKDLFKKIDDIKGTFHARMGMQKGRNSREVKLLSRVQLFVIPWTVAYQAPPPMVFSRQEY